MPLLIIADSVTNPISASDPEDDEEEVEEVEVEEVVELSDFRFRFLLPVRGNKSSSSSI